MTAGMACALIVLSVALASCGRSSTELASEQVADAVQPAPRDLSTPESAVRSYLDWVSFAYRMANSEIPTATMTPEESVRIDSYIELNRQQGQGIDQVLESFNATTTTTVDGLALVVARESWRYRYFSLDTLKYAGDSLTASYETTYALVQSPAGWLVDHVEATADSEVR